MDKCTHNGPQTFIGNIESNFKRFKSWRFGVALTLLSGDFKQTLLTDYSTFNVCGWNQRAFKIVRFATIRLRARKKKHAVLYFELMLSAEIFSKQSLDIGKQKVERRENTELIKLPEHCPLEKRVNRKSVFSNIRDNYGNRQ